MWLVLCHANDMPALWAYQGLKTRGLSPLELVSAESLAYSLRWELHLGTAETSVEITLANGRVVHGDNLRGVLNRLVTVPMEHWRSASATDRDYVLQELTAFYCSWLKALPCPVINPPTPLGLCGQWRHESEWVWLAARAGLPTPVYQQSGLDHVNEQLGEKRLVAPGTPIKTVIVVAREAVGAQAAHEVIEGCIRLAALAETELLGIEFTVNEHGEWIFVGATPMPDLTLGGPALLEVLFRVLTLGKSTQ